MMAGLSGRLHVTRSIRSPTLIRSQRCTARRGCRLVTSRSTAPPQGVLVIDGSLMCYYTDPARRCEALLKQCDSLLWPRDSLPEQRSGALEDAVSYRVVNGVAWLTIERPEARNALSAAVRTGLYAGVRRFNDDDTAKVLV